MSSQALTLEELKHISLEKIVRQVLDKQRPLTIRVSDGQEVTIQPRPRLKPLLVLEGYIPEGWKDAIYG